MRNPWIDLPAEQPYVLQADHASVMTFNQRVQPKHQLDLNLIPQPFMGNRQARLVVLGQNPNLTGGHPDGPVANAIRANLDSDTHGHRIPGFLAEFEHTPNSTWWRKCFKVPLASGFSPQKLARCVLAIEFHGYHSREWRLARDPFPSQRFSFWLVEEAMKRGATIVIMRNRRNWQSVVPDLNTYERIVTIKNPRSATISPRNCGIEGFGQVLDALAETP